MTITRISAMTGNNMDDEVNAAYLCTQCNYAVTPYERVLPCPRCGNMSWRRVPPDHPDVLAQRPA